MLWNRNGDSFNLLNQESLIWAILAICAQVNWVFSQMDLYVYRGPFCPSRLISLPKLAALKFDDLNPGDQWTTPARTVTETDVVQFAAMTGDFNPLHVDHDFAAKGPFKRPIAHGLLGLSWVAGLGCNAPSIDTVAFVAIRNWNFLRPVYFGDTIHVESTVTEKGKVGKRAGTVIWTHTVYNQKGKRVQEGVFETLVAVDKEAE